ncbi:MAG: hypothetical protein ACKPKO_45120, partial [Candidatus Fonsibacter sp.]
LRKYTNRQLLAASPTDTDESKPEKKKKRGRTNNVVGDNVVMSDPVTPEEASLPPSPAYFLLYSLIRQLAVIRLLHQEYESVSVYFEPFAQYIISVVVFL